MHFAAQTNHGDSIDWPVVGYKNIPLQDKTGRCLNMSEIVNDNVNAFGNAISLNLNYFDFL